MDGFRDVEGDAAEGICQLLETFPVHDRKVVDPQVREVLDRLHGQRRTRERERRIDLVRPVARDDDPGVSRDRDDRSALTVAVDVQHHQRIGALGPGDPLLRPRIASGRGGVRTPVGAHQQHIQRLGTVFGDQLDRPVLEPDEDIVDAVDLGRQLVLEVEGCARERKNERHDTDRHTDHEMPQAMSFAWLLIERNWFF